LSGAGRAASEFLPQSKSVLSGQVNPAANFTTDLTAAPAQAKTPSANLTPDSEAVTTHIVSTTTLGSASVPDGIGAPTNSDQTRVVVADQNVAGLAASPISTDGQGNSTGFDASAAFGDEDRDVAVSQVVEVAGASAKGEGTDQVPFNLTVGVTLPFVLTRRAGPADASVSQTEVSWASSAEQSDGMLLQRFVANRDEAAFTALVQRYQAQVQGLCQRVLGDCHAAQDAVQATFLVLARKAGFLGKQGPLGGWLYKVAYHVALRLRTVAVRQRQRDQGVAASRPTSVADVSAAELEGQELRQVLCEELQRLPEKYRAPLVLCYFEGRTHDQAARAIGMPRGSIAKCISEGLERLRERLAQRGLVP
jgi:RNA polymerase sigma factor (sigma-70 family)